MLVLSMNSKRQRRPNVRLGEIGDVSAALACGFSRKSYGDLGPKRWKNDFVNPNINEDNPNFGFLKQKSPEFTVMDPGVLPKISADMQMQQNMENKNPNSAKMSSETLSSDNFDMSKSELNFGPITRKTRDMKRRSRSTKDSLFGGVWNSKLSPQFSSEDGKDYVEKECGGFTSNACNDYNPGNGFKDLSDHETLATSKEACEYDVDNTTCDVWQQGNSIDSSKEDACCERNNEFLKPGVECNETRYGGSHVNNTVSRWLEELGFGKYASVFEMHEVDEETLPLLTLEDLKEMGVFAVGTRRKLYTAIQQLRGGDGVQAARKLPSI